MKAAISSLFLIIFRARFNMNTHISFTWLNYALHLIREIKRNYFLIQQTEIERERESYNPRG